MVARDFGIIVGLMCSFAYASEPVILNFHDSSSVNDTLIYLSDIASYSAPLELKKKVDAICIGPSAPAGYSRLALVTDLIPKISQKLGISVIASSESISRISISTQSRIIKISDFEQSIKSYVSEKTAYPHTNIEFALINGSETIHLLDKPFVHAISGMDSASNQKGHLRINLELTQHGKHLMVPVVCVLKVVMPVYVACSKLLRNDTLNSQNIVITQKDITFYEKEYFLNQGDIMGRTLARSISQGTILSKDLLAPTIDIQKGAEVVLVVKQKNVSLSASGIARQSGAIGSIILVENAVSHKIAKGKIVGKSKVAIAVAGEVL